MKKTIAAGAIAATLALGGLTGTVLGTPSLAAAAGIAGGAAGWVQGALAGLVDDGTITRDQAEAVETALQETRPARGRGHRGPGAHLATVAEALDLSVDELRAARRAGSTVAEVAEAEGVELQVVIDALVAAAEAHLDEKVAAGDLTQAEADERLAAAEERATAFVDGEGTGPRRGQRA